MIILSRDCVIRPYNVYGGYRVAKVTWTWNPKSEDWDQDEQFLGRKVYETEEECDAYIDKYAARLRRA
jgi:hypothetical protein